MWANWVLLAALAANCAMIFKLVYTRHIATKSYVHHVNVMLGIFLVWVVWLYVLAGHHLVFVTIDGGVGGYCVFQLIHFHEIIRQRRKRDERIGRVKHYFETRDERRETAEWN